MYRVESTLQVWRNCVIVVRIDARSGVSTGERFFLDVQVFTYRLGFSVTKLIYHKIRVWILKKVATWNIYCCQLKKLTYTVPCTFWPRRSQNIKYLWTVTDVLQFQKKDLECSCFFCVRIKGNVGCFGLSRWSCIHIWLWSSKMKN